MPINTSKNTAYTANHQFQTPIKPKLKLVDEQTTTADIYDKGHQNSIPNSSTSLNMFKKKRHPKRIKKSNIHLLSLQCEILQSYKKKLSESYSDSVNENYKQELDKIFVIVARISHIENDKKYFIFHCQDQGQTSLKLYFNKHSSKGSQTRLFNHSHLQRVPKARWISNVDELQFESIQGQGIPYFKFFVIYRQIPLFDKSEQSTTSNFNEEKKDDKQANLSDESTRKKFLSHIIGTQFRAYIQHIEKITDFNYLTWHNMHVCFENACEQLAQAQKQNIEEDIEI